MEELERLVLRELLLSPGPVTCAELAGRLGSPEAAVVEAAGRLAARGYPVEVGGGALRLVPVDDLGEACARAPRLGTRLRFSVLHLQRCGSTQDVARALAERGAGEGLVVVAEEQERGRGRLGRAWHSGRGGIWATVLLRPPRLGPLSLATGVAVARALEVLGVEARLKWPNDVEVSGRKVCGILVEASAEGASLYALVGIGLNVNNEIPPELGGRAVSLREVLGRPVPRLPLLLQMLVELDRVYAELREPGSVLSEWRARSSTLGRVVRVETPEGVFEGVAEDVTEEGALLVRLAGGGLRVFHAGDVVHVR